MEKNDLDDEEQNINHEGGKGGVNLFTQRKIERNDQHFLLLFNFPM